MKIGIVLNSNEAETAWNALRFGVTALKEGHAVKLFLLGKGVELEDVKDHKFNTAQQVNSFLEQNGEILACGTCLKARGKTNPAICSFSTMKDLLALAVESDRVVSFG